MGWRKEEAATGKNSRFDASPPPLIEYKTLAHFPGSDWGKVGSLCNNVFTLLQFRFAFRSEFPGTYLFFSMECFLLKSFLAIGTCGSERRRNEMPVISA
jgi:hypothetical protein